MWKTFCHNKHDLPWVQTHDLAHGHLGLYTTYHTDGPKCYLKPMQSYIFAKKGNLEAINFIHFQIQINIRNGKCGETLSFKFVDLQNTVVGNYGKH